MSVGGNSTIYFQTADMMLMWLYGWQTQNKGTILNYKVSAMTADKEPLAAMANAFISSGQLDLNNMSQAEIISALNVLIEKGYLPKGDRYDEIVEKLGNGEKLVEDRSTRPSTSTTSTTTDTNATTTSTTSTTSSRPTSGTRTTTTTTTTRPVTGTRTTATTTTTRPVTGTRTTTN